MSILLPGGISTGCTGEECKNMAYSPEFPAICGIYVFNSHHILCEEYFFLCFKLANVLLEDVGRDAQRMRLTLL